MDFEPVPDLVIEGYRIASITVIEPRFHSSGDAYLIAPNGAVTDLRWKSGSGVASGTLAPATMTGSNGVITIEITTEVRSEADLRAVLDAAVRVVMPLRNPASNNG